MKTLLTIDLSTSVWSVPGGFFWCLKACVGVNQICIFGVTELVFASVSQPAASLSKDALFSRDVQSEHFMVWQETLSCSYVVASHR